MSEILTCLSDTYFDAAERRIIHKAAVVCRDERNHEERVSVSDDGAAGYVSLLGIASCLRAMFLQECGLKK